MMTVLQTWWQCVMVLHPANIGQFLCDWLLTMWLGVDSLSKNIRWLIGSVVSFYLYIRIPEYVLVSSGLGSSIFGVNIAFGIISLEDFRSTLHFATPSLYPLCLIVFMGKLLLVFAGIAFILQPVFLAAKKTAIEKNEMYFNRYAAITHSYFLLFVVMCPLFLICPAAFFSVIDNQKESLKKGLNVLLLLLPWCLVMAGIGVAIYSNLQTSLFDSILYLVRSLGHFIGSGMPIYSLDSWFYTSARSFAILISFWYCHISLFSVLYERLKLWHPALFVARDESWDVLQVESQSVLLCPADMRKFLRDWLQAMMHGLVTFLRVMPIMIVNMLCLAFVCFCINLLSGIFVSLIICPLLFLSMLFMSMIVVVKKTAQSKSIQYFWNDASVVSIKFWFFAIFSPLISIFPLVGFFILDIKTTTFKQLFRAVGRGLVATKHCLFANVGIVCLFVIVFKHLDRGVVLQGILNFSAFTTGLGMLVSLHEFLLGLAFCGASIGLLLFGLSLFSVLFERLKLWHPELFIEGE